MHITSEVLLNKKEEFTSTEYDKQLFEQYKLYVEMADRISARRAVANTFFLTAHTAIISLYAIADKQSLAIGTISSVAFFLVAFVLTIVWWGVIRSYRKLSTGKFYVINNI